MSISYILFVLVSVYLTVSYPLSVYMCVFVCAEFLSLRKYAHK